MTDTTYHVMTQTDGSAPEFEAEFAFRKNAEEHLESLGADFGSPLEIPGDDGTVTIAYNLGPEEGCAIGWIEERSDLPPDDSGFTAGHAYG